jgi:hypothetical protein
MLARSARKRRQRGGAHELHLRDRHGENADGEDRAVRVAAAHVSLVEDDGRSSPGLITELIRQKMNAFIN